MLAFTTMRFCFVGPVDEHREQKGAQKMEGDTVLEGVHVEQRFTPPERQYPDSG